MEANRLIAEAEELSPGDGFRLIAAARVALLAQRPNVARQSVERAATAVRANPFLFYHYELQQLEQQLALLPL